MSALRPIESIRRYSRTLRIHDAAVAGIANSIREYGFNQPIVLDRRGVIIVGDARFLAAQLLGLKKVPVIVAALSPAKARAYRIADNKLYELSTWDPAELSVELSELQAQDLDLSWLGFTERELTALIRHSVNAGNCDPDEIPAPPDDATTQRGDLWELGDHRLFCGDSAVPDDLDRLLDGARIQVVNTDPPYNVNVEPRSNNAIAASGKRKHHQSMDVALHPNKLKPTGAKLRAKDRPLKNDFLSPERFEELLAGWFGNIGRVLIPGGAFYIWGGYANCANYPPALKAAALYFSQAIIWVKEHPVLTRKDFMGNHEWCFYGWREGAAHRYFGPRNLTDVWHVVRATAGGSAIGRGVRLEAVDGSRLDVSPPGADKRPIVPVPTVGTTLYGANVQSDVWSIKKISPQNMVHLTEKPVELATRAMQLSSKPGENVLDLFGGSGSTLIGAEQTGRHAFLMELDPLYCDVICTRWEKFTGKKARRSPNRVPAKRSRPSPSKR